jgi:diguanylate cyclase (GGDEF)-like protein
MLVLVIGLALSAMLTVLLVSSSRRDSQQTFSATAEDVSTTLTTLLHRDADFVTTMRGVVTMAPGITDSGFAAWYAAVDGRNRQVGGLGTAVLAPVPAAQAVRFQAQRNGDPAYRGYVGHPTTLTPHRRGTLCLLRLLTTIMPLDHRMATYVQGDWCDDSTIVGRFERPALRAATDSGHLIVLAIDPSNLPLLYMATAVYRQGAPVSSVAERRRANTGWVISAFDARGMIIQSIGANHTLAVSLEHRNPGQAWTQVAAAGTTPPRNAMRTTTSLGLGGEWRVLIRGTAPRTMPPIAIVLLACTVAAIVIVSALLLLLGRSRERALGMVEEKTGELRHQALHDALTGLPNRVLALDRAEQMLARARRSRAPVAALYVDIDGFKGVNDTFGHAAGDEVLQRVAMRLQAATRDADTAARLSGDEFLVLVDCEGLDGGPERVAGRLRDLSRERCELETAPGRQLSITASIGIAYGLDQSAEELVAEADVALYVAKTSGKNRYVVFAPGMETAAQDRLRLEMDLADALEQHELFLVYQPTIDLRTERTIAVEALLRWRHPARGVLEPERFLTIAEESGLIVEIGRWVLMQACRQTATWNARGFELGVAVNISARQLDDQFPATVRGALDASGLDPSRLMLEITESTLVDDTGATARLLSAIKALGVKVAIDDFGSGYSSLAYLRQFPVDQLKIDQAFVQGVAGSRESSALANTLLRLGRSLHLETLAEGVEDAAQLRALRRHQCDQGQGFLFAHPLEPAELERFLQDQGHQSLAS